MHIKIGDFCQSINPKGSIKATGRVVALIDPLYYMQYMLPPGLVMSTWDENHPGWREGLVAVVHFLTPQKTATLDEWVESGVKNGNSRMHCEETYYTKCPVTHSVSFPIKDLKKVSQ